MRVVLIKKQILFIICLMIFLPFKVNALKNDESQPIQIEADHATVDQKKMISEFTGNVIITKGSLKVHANKGVASQDSQGDRTLTLYGTPVSFEQLGDDGEKIEGQANQFEYNTKTSLAVLTGRARVKKGKSIVMGDVLTYNTETKVYNAMSGSANGVNKKSSGRITVILDQMPNESNGNKK